MQKKIKFYRLSRDTVIQIIGVFFLILIFLLSTWPQSTKKTDELFLKKASFKDLPNWKSDDIAKALIPLQKSCIKILQKNPEDPLGNGGFAGTAKPWQKLCQKTSLYFLSTDTEARDFFEKNFSVYAAFGNNGRDGLFTGYYEPTLYGSYTKKKPYIYPLYTIPKDMIKAKLSDFHEDLKGKSITGRVQGKNFIPYYQRHEIENGALKNQRKEIIWINNLVDVFFLHIQGSGRVILPNKKVLRVGYAGQNGHKYTAIGRELIARGHLTRENVSMQSIRQWLEENPDKANDIMNVNSSYIFFRKLENEGGPLGAQGVPLTPHRSLAVDRQKIPYGVPIFLDAEEPEGEAPLQQLMIAQDTGGAIRGAIRGDFFWGPGKNAAHKAGLMKSRGQFWILLPKSVTVPENKLRKFWHIFK